MSRVPQGREEGDGHHSGAGPRVSQREHASPGSLWSPALTRLSVSKARRHPGLLPPNPGLLSPNPGLWPIPLSRPELVGLGVFASLLKARPATRSVTRCCHRKHSDVPAREDRWSCVDLLLSCGWSSFWRISTVECGRTPAQAMFCSGSLECASKC